MIYSDFILEDKTMNSYIDLPYGYKEILSVDLQKDKKLAGIVNGIAIVLMIVLFIIGNAIVPFGEFYKMGLGATIVMCIGIIVYIILHELVHGIVMYGYSKVKPSYGFTGLYAYAGSKCYFNKKSYIVIALAPIVVWGIVLLVLNLIFQEKWFWVIYFIQIMNISGAGGDLYVTYRFSKLPKDILINDTGVAMTIYSKEYQENKND